MGIVNQLFKKNPDKILLDQILNVFNLKNLDDNKYFNKLDLQKYNTLEKIIGMKVTLEEYYIPCKARYYLNDLTYKNIITILRQLLRTHNYKVESKEKYIQGKKHLFYQVVPLQAPVKTPTKKDTSVTITFD